MTTTTKRGALAGVAALAVAFALLLLGITSAPRADAAESLTVNLASGQGQATQVGEGFLYGVSQDATQPADQYILPLGITAFRGGGHASGGVQSGLCLDANNQGTSNGTAVILWSCNGQANQRWTVNSNGTITGVQSGLCLDGNGAGTTNGTAVILWSCNGQSNQQWFRRG